MTLQQNESEAEQLDNLFVTFARTLLSRMEKWTTTEQVPLTHHISTDFFEHAWPDEMDPGHVEWYHEREEKKNYRAMLNRHGLDSLWKTEEALICMRCWKALIGEPYSFEPPPNFGNSSVGIDLSTGDYILYELMSNELVTPILETVDRYNTLHPTREQLLESLHQFTDVYVAPDIIWDISIPLLSLRSYLQHEEIFGSLHLAPFSVEEKADIWNAFDNAPVEAKRAMPVPIDDFAGAAFHLTYTHTVQRDVTAQRDVTEMRDRLRDHLFEWREKMRAAARGEIPSHLTEMGIELNNIIAALRLVKSGNVEVLAIFERQRRRFPVRKSGLIYVLSNRRRHHYGNVYVLNEADLPAIRRCFDQLQSLHILSADANQSQGQLSVALRRFNQAYERDLYEDQIIDLTIALESCLLADVSDGELNYRLTLRGAALLAQAKLWNPARAQSLLKAIYAIRSAIVHEGQQLTNLGRNQRKILQKLEISPEEFPQQCENIVRDILRIYLHRLSQGETSRTVCTGLELYIVQSLIVEAGEETAYP